MLPYRPPHQRQPFAARVRFACTALALVSCAACDPTSDSRVSPSPLQAASVAAPVVYGDDDRSDWFAHPDEALRALTEASIVALIRPRNLDESDPGDVRITSRLLGPSRDLCEDERFYDQPRAANCSGTLVDSDLVLTAGHCVDDLDDCRNYRFVFDYLYEAEGALRTIVAAEDVYRCAELVVRRDSGGVDYAIVRLDRPVHESHAPAPVRAGGGPMAAGDEVTVIGFGSGIPAKIDDGGAVLDPRARRLDYFVATTDTFGGNSGSGVFDSDTLELVGVLVRGETDYVEDDDAGCTRVNVLPADGGEDGGEDIVYAANAVEAYCASGRGGVLCEGPGGWCRACTEDDACVTGWSCAPAPHAPGSAWCGPPCGSDDECRLDHACVEGSCRPLLQQRCIEGQPWSVDACGLRLEQLDECGADELCASGACVAAGEGNDCGRAASLGRVEPGTTRRVTGVVDEHYSDVFRGSCGGEGPDRVYAFELAEPARVVATATGFDTLLHLRATCDDAESELACVDDSSPPGSRGARVTAELGPGTWWLVADAYQANPSGTPTLALELEVQTLCDCRAGERRCAGTVAETCESAGELCPEWRGTRCASHQTCVVDRCAARGPWDTCADTRRIPAVSASYGGDLSFGAGDDARASCGGEGGDVVLEFRLDEPTRVEVAIAGALVHLRAACEDPDSEVACGGPIAGAPAFVAELPEGAWFLFVDAPSPSEAQGWELALDFEPSCQDECALDDPPSCADGGERRCGDFDADSCSELGPARACGPGFECIDGAGCVASPPDRDAGLDGSGSPDAGDGGGDDAGQDSGARGPGRSRGCASSAFGDGRSTGRSTGSAAPWSAAALLLFVSASRARGRRRGVVLTGAR